MYTKSSDKPRLGAILLVLLWCLAPLGAASLAAGPAETVELESADGHLLTGTLWPNESGPGVLLLHQCNSSRAMYDELGGLLSNAGFKVLAIDFRGFGDSKGNDLDLADGGREDWQRAMAGFPSDAEAAYEFLAKRGGGVVAGALGASCGGWQVVGLAHAHPELGRLGFFSSGLKPDHVRDLLRMTDREFLMIAAKGDAGAVGPAGSLAYRAKDRTELFLYDGEAHGYPLFEQDPELANKIVDYYRPLLK